MSNDKAYEIIGRMLMNLGSSTILFLNNIREIKWKTIDSNGLISKSIKKIPKASRTKRVKISTDVNQEEFLVVHKPINLDGVELRVEVAYRIGKNSHNKTSIKPLEKPSKLIVYFPTEKETHLNFYIHGPYRTTPNRENIPLDDEQNKHIIDATANLVAESIHMIKKIGLLDVDFLNVMPLDSEKVVNYIYSKIFNQVKDKLLSEKLLPTLDSKYGRPSDVVLPKRHDITSLLNHKDLNLMFSKKYWISSDIEYYATEHLKQYLTKVLGVKEIGIEDFVLMISDQSLIGKSDNWLRKFYSYISKSPHLWRDEGNKSRGILRNKPIIRLENGEMISPFDSAGEPQAYLPGNTSHRYRTVKKYFMNHKDSAKFLKELGLSEPDLFAEIYEYILPNYINKPPIINKVYFDDVLKLLNGYVRLPQSKKVEFLRNLKERSFILSKSNLNSEYTLRRPTEAYFDTSELREYFEGDEETYFVSDDLIKRFKNYKIESFLNEIGVLKYPRTVEKVGIAALTKDELYHRVGNTSRSVSRVDYDYDGLDNFFNRLTSKKSVLLWNFLLKNIESMSSWDAERFFKGVDKWEYWGNNAKEIDASFTIKLRDKAWILDQTGNFRKPPEITFEEISNLYLKEGKNLETLKKALNFKPDYIKLLPQEDRERLELTRLIPIEKLRSMVIDDLKGPTLKEDIKWAPQVEPEDSPVKFLDYIPSKPKRRSSFNTPTEDRGEPGTNYEVGEESYKNIDTRGKQIIGDWGEKHVYTYLKEKYSEHSVKLEESINGLSITDELGSEYEITWMNKNGNRGVGYDFLIKKDGKIFEYIEVKAKIKPTLEVVEMTGAQWELARELFEKNLGEKYSLYIVTNAGVVDSKIHKLSNPFKMWSEGKIEAHPINLLL